MRKIDEVSISYDMKAIKEFEKHLDEAPALKSFIIEGLETIDVHLDTFGRYIFAIENRSKACFLLKRDRNFEAFEGIVDPYICKFTCYNEILEDSTINCLIAIRSKCNSLIFQAKEEYQFNILTKAGYKFHTINKDSLIFVSKDTNIFNSMKGRSFIVKEKTEK